MTGTADPDALREQEFRLAVVLNGGVSLAVWMGGVAYELQRLTRAVTRPDPTEGPAGPEAGYGPVLRMARSRAVVDVISGTSAGGINGAALALAQVNEKADVLELRSMWAEQGRMEELLRQPFQGDPNSLLRGDDYFWPQLRRAMASLVTPFERRCDPEGRPTPVDLTVTATLLSGAQQVVRDSHGVDLPQRLHASSFRFAFGPQHERGHDAQRSEAEARRKAEAMALASRCSASFPFAFEPSFVPIGPDAAAATDRPDMADFADWVGGAPVAGEDRSRFAVDGGVLANTPTEAALAAIDRHRADGPVRRSMLLVFPHAPQVSADRGDDPERPPSAAGTLSGVLSALQAQGSRTYVERLEQHNRRAEDWRGGRRDVLAAVGTEVADLYRLVDVSWPHYHHLRRRKAALDLSVRVAPHLSSQLPQEVVREDAAAAQDEAWAARELSYVPQSPPVGRALQLGQGWHWGFTVALGVADAVQEILRAALDVADDEQLRVLVARVRAVSDQTERIRAARDAVDDVWHEDPYLSSLRPDKDYWRARLVAYRRAMVGPHPDDRRTFARLLVETGAGDRDRALGLLCARDGTEGKEVRHSVRRCVDGLVRVQGHLRAIMDTPGGAALAPWAGVLHQPRLEQVPQVDGGNEPADPVDRLLQRLLALDVATWLVADGPATGTALPVKLVQLSLQTTHPWARQSLTPDDKAAGMELARFGGFLKRSWRMNDWTWGRLDAVTMLCRAVLEPRRVRQVAAALVLPDLSDGADVPEDAARRADALLAELDASYGGAVPADEAVRTLRAEARAELLEVLGPRGAEQLALPRVAAYAAYPLQARLVLEELPVLAGAVELDRIDGASRRSRGERFLTEQRALLAEIADRTPETDWLALGGRGLAAFDAAGIGREPIADELASDALIRTGAKAAGVAATVASGSRSGVKAVRQVATAVRGAVLLPYWVVQGLTGASVVAQFLATLGLVLGGTLLVLSLFGVMGDLAALGGAVGAATLLTAFAYAAFRSGSVLHAAALLAPVGPAVAYALDATPGDGAPEAAGRIITLGALVAALYLVGRLPWPTRSPLTTVVGTARTLWTRRRRALLVAVGVLLVLAVLVALAYAGWLRRWYELLPAGLREAVEAWPYPPVFFVVATAVLVVAGVVAGYVAGARCRPWRAGPGTVDGAPTTRPWSLHAEADGLRIDHGAFRLAPVSVPAGVAATWAVVYGAAYLAAAWAVWAWAARDEAGELAGWLRFTLWWCAGVAVLLVAVAPFVLGRRVRLDVATALAASELDLRDASPAQVLDRLLTLDLAHEFLAGPGRRITARSADRLVLTRGAQRALARARVIRNGR